MSDPKPQAAALYQNAEDLHPLHWERLAARNPMEAAGAAACPWDGEAFRLPLLGRILVVSPGARTLGFAGEPGAQVGFMRALVAVTYLYQAMEADPAGKWVAFADLPGGATFFQGHHALPLSALAKTFGPAPDRLVSAARLLGGKAADQAFGADAAVELPALPRFGLNVLVWGESPEFPASAAMLIDSRSHLHLPLDVLWALANVAVQDLTRA